MIQTINGNPISHTRVGEDDRPAILAVVANLNVPHGCQPQCQAPTLPKPNHLPMSYTSTDELTSLLERSINSHLHSHTPTSFKTSNYTWFLPNLNKHPNQKLSTKNNKTSCPSNSIPKPFCQKERTTIFTQKTQRTTAFTQKLSLTGGKISGIDQGTAQGIKLGEQE